MANQIITISRQFGSGGRLIGAKLAEKLGVPFYDKGILAKIAEEHGYSVEMMEEDEKRAEHGFFYSLSNILGVPGYSTENLSVNDQFFMAQFEYISKLADEGKGGVIIGRCADYVLRNHPDVTNIFVYAEKDVRVKRALEIYGVPEKDIEKNMHSVDKARANYYKYHTGRKWADPLSYDLCINSGNIAIDDIVDLIVEFVEIKNK